VTCTTSVIGTPALTPTETCCASALVAAPKTRQATAILPPTRDGNHFRAAGWWIFSFGLPHGKQSSTSKHDFHLHPHAADAAVREIAIQEAPRRSAIDAHLRNLDKLGVIECVQRFPAKLQPPLLS
jgi:hypothetical protein